MEMLDGIVIVVEEMLVVIDGFIFLENFGQYLNQLCASNVFKDILDGKIDIFIKIFLLFFSDYVNKILNSLVQNILLYRHKLTTHNYLEKQKFAYLISQFW